MDAKFTPDERRRLAEQIGANEQYLYQCLTGRREMDPIKARNAESLTGGKLMRWDVCPRSWYLIWPEIARLDGAPPVPEAAHA